MALVIGPHGQPSESGKSVREAAAVNYKKAVDKRLIRGRSIEGVAAASLYLPVASAVPRPLTKSVKPPAFAKKSVEPTGYGL